jgi:hypothetical protein
MQHAFDFPGIRVRKIANVRIFCLFLQFLQSTFNLVGLDGLAPVRA